MLRSYRDAFVPSSSAPRLTRSSVSRRCRADTAEEAEHLAAPLDLAWLRIGQGKRGPSPTLDEALAYEYTPAEEAHAPRRTAARHVVGDAGVGGRLRCATSSSERQADEVMVLTMAPDAATSRRRSYELLAAARLD